MFDDDLVVAAILRDLLGLADAVTLDWRRRDNVQQEPGGAWVHSEEGPILHQVQRRLFFTSVSNAPIGSRRWTSAS